MGPPELPSHVESNVDSWDRLSSHMHVQVLMKPCGLLVKCTDYLVISPYLNRSYHSTSGGLYNPSLLAQSYRSTAT